MVATGSLTPSSCTTRRYRCTVGPSPSERPTRQVAADNGRLYLYDCSSVPVAALLLFGGHLSVSKDGRLVSVHKWLHFKMAEVHAVLLQTVQEEFEDLLRKKAEDPFVDISFVQGVLRAVLEALLDSPLTN